MASHRTVEDVRLLNRGRADAGAGSDEVACGVPHVPVADREAVIIVDVPCVFETVHGLPHCLVRRVEVLCDTADGVTTLDGEDDLRRRVVENLVLPTDPSKGG